MIDIRIDKETCIKCSKCVKICPVYIFSQAEPKAAIGVNRMNSCIECGHCVSACPTESITHSEFPAEKIHNVNNELLPSPEQVLALLRTRRSNRAVRKTAVPDELLQQIVEAAHLAPTAGNGQEVSFTLVTDPELLQKITELTIHTYEATIKKMTNPFIKPFLNKLAPGALKALPKLKSVVGVHKKGIDVIQRHAKAILFIHTPAHSTFGVQDANLAYQNGSLMAESLGVTQFYTGFICSAANLDKKRTLEKMLGIDGVIHAGMALAMPLFKFPRYVDKHDLRLNKL